MVINLTKPLYVETNISDVETNIARVPIDTFIENIQNIEWVKSTCTVNGKRIIDSEKRHSSKYYENVHIDFSQIQGLINVLHIVNRKHNKELIKYEQGDKFEKHKDSKLEPLHCYTGLLYSPGDYKGGDLIIYNEDGTVEVIETSGDAWKFVIFDVNLYHESTPIESGAKYVFKFPLYDEHYPTYYSSDEDLCD